MFSAIDIKWTKLYFMMEIISLKKSTLNIRQNTMNFK